MDKDRMEGIGKQAAGAVMGDAKLKTEGASEKTAGKIQNAVGGAKDAVREALDKSDDAA